MRRIVVIAHNLRSTYNVGALLRTAEGLGIDFVYFTGYTPYPLAVHDSRLPHESHKLAKQIHKTALGAEDSQPWNFEPDVLKVISSLKSQGYSIVGLEQYTEAISLPSYTPPSRVAILIGREVEGIEHDLLARCDTHLQIPMYGNKESFNVIQAAAMALYHCRFWDSFTK